MLVTPALENDTKITSFFTLFYDRDDITCSRAINGMLHFMITAQAAGGISTR